jgi:AraC family transcriptional regulator, regulatory protein of adaptative response / methylated-DNA-[protein]-cysteine methyltransferase
MDLLPTPDVMYRALVERDGAFDGLFLVGVRTTGIFCRPVCPARKPRPENVAWFADAEAAERAGFRACKRCRPHEAPGRHPAWVERLIAAVERDPARRVSDDALRRAELSPVRARRYFRERFGMTFQAWQRARRLGLARERIAAGGAVLDAALDSGFESASGFRDAFQKLFGAPPARASARPALVAREIGSPIGPLLAAASTDGVALLEFVDRASLASQAARMQRWFEAPVVPGTNRHLAALERELAQYFAGERTRFDVALAVAGTPFQRAVWEKLLGIPHGATRSYRAIAADLDRPGAQRAVGRANGLNRIAIVIPCHRVVRDDGTLCGYGGGLWRKRWLLAHERGRGAATVTRARTRPA